MEVRELTRNECTTLMTHNHVAHLACASSAQQPYIVPIYVAYDADEEILYGFSTSGQKIEFLRSNPRACVEIDEIDAKGERWSSVIIQGHFEELSDSPEHEAARKRAYELLKRHASWWVPAYLRTPEEKARNQTNSLEPIYFRITIDDLSGRRVDRAA